MSSNDGVFLYIGIVAIWAGFLIPAWIRRPHGSQADLIEEVDEPADATDWTDAESADGTEDAAWTTGAEWAEWADGADAPEADNGIASRSQYREHVPDYAEAEHRPDAEPVARRSRDTARSSRTARVPPPRTPQAHPPAGYSAAGQSPCVQPSAARPAQRPLAPSSAGSHPPLTASPRAAGPSPSRKQMLRARRRMLTILVTLSLLTGGFVAVGLVQWWICLPPIAMLALYVLLLREIAMADAQLAAKRAAWEARAAARTRAARQAHEAQAHAEQVARQRRHEEWAAMAAEPGAEIIDISSRIGDQLYDQYADAAVRAVGD